MFAVIDGETAQVGEAAVVGDVSHGVVRRGSVQETLSHGVEAARPDEFGRTHLKVLDKGTLEGAQRDTGVTAQVR